MLWRVGRPRNSCRFHTFARLFLFFFSLLFVKLLMFRVKGGPYVGANKAVEKLHIHARGRREGKGRGQVKKENKRKCKDKYPKIKGK